MGLLNIIWIIIFLVLGVGLTVQAFDTINFGAWDNIFGILIFFVALFGVYCMTKDTSQFVLRLRSRYGPVKRRLEEKKAGVFKIKKVTSKIWETLKS